MRVAVPPESSNETLFTRTDEVREKRNREKIERHNLLTVLSGSLPTSNYVFLNSFDCVLSYVKWGYYQLLGPPGFHRDQGNIFKGTKYHTNTVGFHH